MELQVTPIIKKNFATGELVILLFFFFLSKNQTIMITVLRLLPQLVAPPSLSNAQMYRLLIYLDTQLSLFCDQDLFLPDYIVEEW